MAQDSKTLDYIARIDRLCKAVNEVVSMNGEGKSASTIAKETGASEASVKKILAGDCSRIPTRDVDAIVQYRKNLDFLTKK